MKKSDPKTNLKEAVLYARVSSLKQMKEGHGLEGQLQRCRQYAEQNSYHVKAEFTDEGVSGKTADRPQVQAMIDYIAKQPPGITVIMDEVNRMARENIAYYYLKEAIKKVGGQIAYVSQKFDNSAEGEFIEGIIVQIGAYERTHNTHRTINRMVSRTEGGLWPYGVFVGYKPSSVKCIREPDEAVAPVIKRALEGYAYGEFINFEDVARYINEQRVINFKGNKIRTNGDRAKKLLNSSWFHAGFVQLPKRNVERRKGQHQPIISLDVLERIEGRLAGKRISKFRTNINADFPLRGYVLCGSCQKPMTSAFSGKGRYHGYYDCRTPGCEMRRCGVPYADIHDEFHDLLRSIKPHETLMEKAADILRKVWQKEWQSFDKDRQKWGKELSELEEEVQSYVKELVATKEATVKTAINKEIEACSKRCELLKRKISNTSEAKDDFESVLQKVIRVVCKPDSIWLKADLPMKQTIQRLIFPKPLIYDQKAKKFRNVVTCCVYSLFERNGRKKPSLVHPKRVELLTF